MHSWLLCKETRWKAKKYSGHGQKKSSSHVILVPGIIKEQVVTVGRKMTGGEKSVQRKKCSVAFENIMDNTRMERKITGTLIKSYIWPL